MNVLFQALRIAEALLPFLVLLVCAFVAVSCICRVNAAAVKRWRITAPQAMYIGFGFWAMNTMAEVIMGRVDAGACQLGVGLSILLHLYLSYPEWKGHDVVGDIAHWEDHDADPTRT